MLWTHSGIPSEKAQCAQAIIIATDMSSVVLFATVRIYIYWPVETFDTPRFVFTSGVSFTFNDNYLR